MKLIINNIIHEFDENTSLEKAIETLELKEMNGIALALNEEIIPRSEWQKTILFDEDKIIIIGAVAGG
ncbi:MAG: sulfur carrier protein ThiS [Sphingobacteriales bacterium]|nr:MAG: sulfur carrier protein ThiS [Sphingobacteriales bacterium]